VLILRLDAVTKVDIIILLPHLTKIPKSRNEKGNSVLWGWREAQIKTGHTGRIPPFPRLLSASGYWRTNATGRLLRTCPSGQLAVVTE
jgi:hypothetical protein